MSKNDIEAEFGEAEIKEIIHGVCALSERGKTNLAKLIYNFTILDEEGRLKVLLEMKAIADREAGARDWLKKARKARGMTMATVAQKLGISESYYCMIEAGNRKERLDIPIASKISETLGVPLAEITDVEKER